ncbi:IS5 family transposase [Micrococcus luteus]|uniref:IS5 family transposase n=1 Tax=Micrococcus luteus TaxID=1270 RepID=UPI0035E3CBE9
MWTWHRRLAEEGTWDTVLAKLTAAADAEGRVDWSVPVDSTIARATSTPRTPRATQGAGSNYKNLREELPDHGSGRSRGGLSTKIHQLVDGAGLPLVSLITPGQAGDSPMLLPLLGQLCVARPAGRPRTRPAAVLGGKAYSSRAIRSHLRARGIKAVIPEPADQQGHRRRRGACGGRPVGIDAAAYKGRNLIERQYAHLKQWRGLATRYDKYAIVYRAAVVLSAVIAWSRLLSDTP